MSIAYKLLPITESSSSSDINAPLIEPLAEPLVRAKSGRTTGLRAQPASRDSLQFSDSDTDLSVPKVRSKSGRTTGVRGDTTGRDSPFGDPYLPTFLDEDNPRLKTSVSS